MDKVIENLITSIAGLGSGYIVAEAYKQFVPPSTKKSWEHGVGIHHGEAGIMLLGVGIISSLLSYSEKNQKALNTSLFAATVGTGFAIHDHKNAHKWFRSKKNFA